MLLITIAYLAFVSLGLPDTLIGVAWPSVRAEFALTQAAVSGVFLGAGIGYFVSSAATGRLLRMGVGALLATSTTLVAVALVGFATAHAWWLFPICAVLHGLGSGAIDAGLNHYAAHNFSARHMNWLHACYSVGATSGPVIMTAAIARGSWRGGYVTVATIVAALAALFVLTRRRWQADAADLPERSAARATGLVWLQVAIFFVYTGLELTVGQWTFTWLTEGRRLTPELAGALVTIYWASILIGRVAFGFVVARVEMDRLVRCCTVAAVAGVALLHASTGAAAAGAGLALIGLALAPLYPCLMARTPARLGPQASLYAIGWQVAAAMVGGAAMPSATAALAQRYGLEIVPVAALALALALLALHEAIVRAQPAAAFGTPKERNELTS